MKSQIISVLRDQKTSVSEFRKACKKIANLMAIEALKKIKEKKKSKQSIVLILILRSSVALLDSFLNYFENASIGFLGIKRNEKTFIPKKYFENIPKIKPKDNIVILDPMIATGNTLKMAIKTLIRKNAKEQNILISSIIASKEGLLNIKTGYKKIIIQTVCIDEKLNSKKIIIPGLGDFGDRFFNT